MKQALVRAVHGSIYKELLESMKSIAFFGTPHRGGNGADVGSIIASIGFIISSSIKNNFMETLQKGSTNAEAIHDFFKKEQALNYKIVSFFKTLPYKRGFGLVSNIYHSRSSQLTNCEDCR